MGELPASVGQRLLWLMDHYRGARNSFNEQVLWHLREPCDISRMRTAVQRLHDRHDALRTTFVSRKRALLQVVAPPSPVALVHRDVSDRPDPRAAARELIAEQVTTAIDLDRWPTRSVLVTLAPDHHILVLTVHHYVTDDWSNALLSRDIRHLYQDPEPLPEVGWQFPTWAAWHRDLLEGGTGARLVDYWRGQLSGARLVELPARVRRPPAGDGPGPGGDGPGPGGDGPGPGGDGPGPVAVELPIPAPVAAGLHRLARQHRTTLFPVMLSLFYLVLQRATGQHDLTVASLFANRSRPEVRETVGFFVTMVLLRCRLSPGQPFTDLLRLARGVVMDGLRHQELPSQLLPPGTVGGSGRPDDVMFQLLGSFLARADMDGDELDDLEVQLTRSRFALEFVVVPQGDGLTALVLCDRDRFTDQWAQRLVADYVRLAAAVVDDPGATYYGAG
jgi:hypothetical protein